MEFDHLNDLYVFRYGVDLPFGEAQVAEWIDAPATNSDEQYRYFHQRYTQHLRSNAAPDADFEEMLAVFDGDWQPVTVVYIKTETQLLSFFFNADQSQLLGMYPRAGIIVP
jgi:hypothetical protein